uniref:NADH-ubiquinone oxidoreductase chain 2 n=2 Tax=Rhacodactylus auriculatus TaxID=143537 RepID=J7IP74_9SAUR|nr:NADH dehydrogenase subunit 2 [Rhacodactylus auriculatus]AFQ41970.1 NADH dehydrogenase subunit 2 [Rhacodactylus auriculatus]AFQ41982.1 NADH dehydrogenase subunit 2 [Rhacodactylus auriculatus]AFQ41983.1 NADH dehydrogenase subunit 2 [Rhacodactylus auriculatus]AFQ41984.1 NADH dehydrogenase subunit 2 [Rhacodactylus auriculatus]
MNPTTQALLYLSMILGTTITMSSSHWILAWAGLEMNTLAIIPIISKQHHPRATEAATKYFLTQATASAVILFASSMNAWKTGQWDIYQTSSLESVTVLTLALAMKLGLAPLHFWLPEVLQGSTLLTTTIISTWQKMAPITILYMTANNLNQHTLMTLGITSAILGGWMGLNQTQTRKIMAFSSIAHMGWVFMALAMNPNLTLLTLLIYLTLTTAMFTSLMTTSSKTLMDLGTTWPQTPALLSTTMLTLMSLGGLPPLTGFMPKWLILKELTANNFPTVSILMALSTLPSLFFYLRMSHMTSLTLPPETSNTKYKWRFKSNNIPITTPTMILAGLLLPVTPLIINIC